MGFCSRGQMLHEPTDAPRSVLKLVVIRIFYECVVLTHRSCTALFEEAELREISHTRRRFEKCSQQRM